MATILRIKNEFSLIYDYVVYVESVSLDSGGVVMDEYIEKQFRFRSKEEAIKKYDSIVLPDVSTSEKEDGASYKSLLFFYYVADNDDLHENGVDDVALYGNASSINTGTEKKYSKLIEQLTR